MVGVNAFAYDCVVDGIYYNLNNEEMTAKVVSSPDGYSGDIVIPSEITFSGPMLPTSNRAVTANSSGEMTYRVTSIGNRAFYECTGLTSVTIGNNVTYIGEMAFWGCTGLTSITIGNNVTYIGEMAFWDCEGLTSITIYSNNIAHNDDFLRYDFPNLTSVIFHCEYIGNWFRGMGIKEIVIGDEVKTIGNEAFKYCGGLTNVTIPNGVTTIGWGAFYRCTGLTNVTIPNGVTTIGKEAFCDCTNLTNITIGNGVTTIEKDAFRDCTSLEKVIVSDIAAWCSIQFEGNYSSNPLRYAHHLYSDENTEIKELVIPDNVTTIGSLLFSGCTGFTSVIIGNGVTTIGDGAFSDCTGLTSVTIGNNVDSIRTQAFRNCTGLEKVIVSDIAAWCSIQFGSPGDPYLGYNRADSNPIYYAHHLYSDENTEIKDLVIPDNVTTIADIAFSGCSGLTSVTIGNSVTTIGSAFSGCTGLTSVTIPNGVTTIGSSAFSSCEGLTSVTFGNGVTSIGSSAFSYCTSLIKVDYSSIEHLCSIKLDSYNIYYECPFHHLYINGEEVKDLIVPETITSIGKYVFYSCLLRNVMLKHQTPPTVSKYTFSDPTRYHATLYVPAGTWDSYAYDDGWYTFINIRETATEEAQLMSTRSYTLMDAQKFSYQVYDPVNNGISTITSTGVDENNPNHCWQTLTVEGQRYLYNIGARRFAVPSADGLVLTDKARSLSVTDGKDGLLFDNQTDRQWAMVVNEKMAVDTHAEEAVTTAIALMKADSSLPTSVCYGVDGRRHETTQRGLNILRMSDGTVRKVMVK